MLTEANSWLEPLLFICGAQGVSILTLAYTPATATFIRKLAIVIVAVLTLLGHLTLFQLSYRGGTRCMTATFAWAQLLNSNDLLCLSEYDFFGSNRDNGQQSSTSRLWWAIGMQWNLRRIGCVQAVQRHVIFSTFDESYVPSRTYFLCRCALQLAAWLAYMAFGAFQPRPPVSAISAEKQFLIHGWSSISAEDLTTRVMFTFFWYIGITAVSQVCYNAAALVFVGLGLSQVSAWPPWFGHVSEAYSVRKFWSATWHQTWRHLLTRNADMLAFDVLQLPKNTLLTRYTRLCLCFLLSGLVHLASDLAIGVPAQHSGAVTYFALQSLAIMLEDLVQAANQRTRIVQGQIMKRAIGFLWVAVWFVVVTPQWNYPPARHMRPFSDDMIDFSFLKRKAA